MASSSCSSSILLPSTIHSHSSSSSHSLLPIRSCSLNSPFDHQTRLLTTLTTTSLPLKVTTHSTRNLTLKASTLEENVSSVIDAIPSLPIYNELKLKLLTAVSGLNKGLVAKEEDMKKVDAAAKELEEVGGLVDLSANLDKLQGRWKLIYSSAFSSRTLGGSRPGPPIGRLLPITLGQVFQRIDTFSKDFDNIVELQLGAPWPLPPVEVTATLAHKFELTGLSICFLVTL
ncbi:hypothetical protein AQUCO_01700770v1 [Aquilegia coerulea]|uniref:Plastid lipid-associated protein/fibrillin conserved domain-containing protein n=1 Tax=Aquilegia coerulea TaxID=218851 RepID=A0A2G5DPU5_AQUCA|nr:hypothetical protein AQUCO_01700770v1 [Aquilegia coerulea]